MSPVLRPHTLRLRDTLERLRQTTGTSHKSIRDILQLSSRDYSALRNLKADLPLSSAVRLAEYFKLNLDNLLEGRIDYSALSAHAEGNLSYIPDRYLVGAHSRKRIVNLTLDHVARTRGWRQRLQVLRHFQLNECAFAQSSDPINIVFVSELFSHLKTLNYCASDFEEVGMMALQPSSPLGTLFRKERDVMSLFEKMFTVHQEHFEMNCIYRTSKLTSNQVVVESRPRQQVQDELRIKQVGSPEICTGRKGIIKIAPTILGAPAAQVFEDRCIHRGDPKCRFRIHFSNRRAPTRTPTRTYAH